MAIQNLNKVATLSASDLLALFSVSVGSDAATTLGSLLAWLQQQLSASGGFVTQYSAPSATGFSTQVVPVTTGGSVFLLLLPAAAYAAGTITLPPQASSVDGQEVMVSCTQAVTTLTVSASGATVNGAPSTLAANGFFRMRYDGVLQSWYRVG